MPWVVHVGSYCEMCRSVILYSVWAYSLAPFRVTSSMCLHVQGSRLHVIVRGHSDDDIGSFTTYRVAAALGFDVSNR